MTKFIMLQINEINTVFNHSGESSEYFAVENKYSFKSPFEISRIESIILRLIRNNTLLSIIDITEQTGYSRTKVSECINTLLEKGIIVQAGSSKSTGGRRAAVYGFNNESGLLLGADIGATSLDILVTTLSGKRLLRHSEAALVSDGPEVVLGRVCDLFTELLENENLSNRILGIGIGVPGPVDFASGMVVSPPIMPGWDRFPIIDFINQKFPGVLVVVDNDVSIMAIGEHAIGKAVGVKNFIFVKVGTGIGAGIILNNQIFRGADGCAGDIGHICVDKDGPVCSCGNIGCLESLSGGGAISQIATQAAEQGKSKNLHSRLEKANGKITPQDVAQAAQEGDCFSIELIKDSGRLIGDVLAGLVNFANPQMIVIGGGVSNFGDIFLSTIRQTIFNRSLPLATKNLAVVFSAIPCDAGVTGAINLVMDIALSPG